MLFSDRNVDKTVNKNDLWNYVKKSDSPTFGDTNSKHQVVVFVDFNCPTCRKFYEKEYKNTIQPAIKNKKIAYAEVQHPFINQESKQYATISHYVYQVARQKAYEKYKRLAYHYNTTPKDVLKRLHLDKDKHMEVLDLYNDHKDAGYNLNQDKTFKVTHTPSVYVDGKLLKDYSQLNKYIKK